MGRNLQALYYNPGSGKPHRMVRQNGKIFMHFIDKSTPGNMFHHVVSYRRSLVLILCTILFLETQADSDICNICNCNSLTTRIYCRGRNLLSIPQPIPTNVEYLYLGGNSIATIKEGAFTGLSNLNVLRLDNNNISTIKEGTFTGLSNLKELTLNENNISTMKEGAFTGLSNLNAIALNENNISTIKEGAFTGLSNLKELDLGGNNIATIKEGAFTGLSNLKISSEREQHCNNQRRSIHGAFKFKQIKSLEEQHFNHQRRSIYGAFKFKHIISEREQHSNHQRRSIHGAFKFKGISQCLMLYHKYFPYNLFYSFFTDIDICTRTTLQPSQKIFDNNPIEKYEDGAFLFLPSIATMNFSVDLKRIQSSLYYYSYLRNNNLMKCGCHLPAFVKYIKKVYNRIVAVSGKCLEGSGKRIPILDYSQCQNYSLFQRNLQCQTCSGIICNKSEVTSCPGTEPVCRFAISMNGAKLKTERSCSTYRKCVEAMRNNTLTCNKRTNGTSCTGCCVGHLCNKNDFIGWTKSFVFRLIFKKFNEYKIPAENISRAIEHDLSTVTGTFRVEDCGSNRNKIFAIYCTVFSEMTESQLRHNISETLNKSQAFLNLGVKKSHMKFLDEMVCDESTTSTNNRAFSWPMTKIGTTAEIPCHGNVATRHCSSRTMGHPEMASSQNLSSQKCSPFTGIWQEPDMSQCYNAEQSKGIDDGWTKSFAFRLILKSFNEYKKPAENISRAMEHEFLTVDGKFRVEYSGVQSQQRRNISQVLNTFQALLNMNLLDESKYRVSSFF
ncbi:adhesion G-protein coupled receptor G6-like isoform X2 [Octopus vulgaris]|uniref:Adhesion G-protein coupled receptor G6-like isoform X2 n=1 Tax=Octopus vulgaris TaxID=6645 RepID=A0AA36HHC1_OCTVU|nr:adhesion G-protein coupled receptor G6-like isoform X2 [Octopus vulgaris]